MKKFKKFNSNENLVDHVKVLPNSSWQYEKNENCVYIENLDSKNLTNNEINKIINQFLTSSQATKQIKINSIKVYKDCIYIIFLNKNDAISAANFFNNYALKNSKLNSFLINSIDSNQETDCQDEAENYEYECKNLFWTDSIECEIIVSNRLLKYLNYLKFKN